MGRRKRMYAVSLEGVGLVSGTLGYSRREAIRNLMGGNIIPARWEECKKAGYRTVQALVEITGRYGTRRSTERSAR